MPESGTRVNQVPPTPEVTAAPLARSSSGVSGVRLAARSGSLTGKSLRLPSGSAPLFR
ncbi:hypothetical protein Kisp02_36120 [Kineosporia sp. NBRC 101731]|nr:hypothetical protein Kisp02_36120 [Kineosporia sp. NBRC 101731]